MLRAFDAGDGDSSFSFNTFADSDDVLVGDTHFLLGAEFKRSGPDLILLGDDGKRLVIADYFNHERAPNLVGPDGATLTGEIVTRLAGPAAPGQYAQATPQGTAVAIGRADKVSGVVQVTHANGVIEALTPGSIIYKGDVIQTGQDASLAVSFGDGTTLNFFANTRMVMNEFAYDSSSNANSGVLTLVRGHDPSSHANSGVFTLVRGSFALIAGQIATTGGLDIETPVATIGIRGTSVVLAEIEPLQRYQFWAPEHVNPDGTLGGPSTYSLTLRTATGVISLAQVSTGNVAILNATGIGQIPQVTVQPPSALAGIDTEGARLMQDLFQPLVDSRSNDLQNLPPPPQVVPLQPNQFPPGQQPGQDQPGQPDQPGRRGDIDGPIKTVAAPGSLPGSSTSPAILASDKLPSLDSKPPGLVDTPFRPDTQLIQASVGVVLSNPAIVNAAQVFTTPVASPFSAADPIVAHLNNAPTVAAALTAARVEGDAPFALNVLAGASDPDDGETAALSIANVTYAVDGGTASSTPPAGVTLSGSTLSVDPNNPAFGHLALGQTQTIVVSYAVADPHGAAVSQTETITITGTNDIPTVAAALTAARVEGDAPFALNVLAGASDPDDGETAALSIANVTYAVDGGTASSTPPAGVTLSGSTLSVDPNNPAFGHLALGQTQTIVVSYAVADPHGAAVSQTETITITGTNDIPTVAAALTAARVEGDAPFALNVLAGASDPDDGETAALSIANVTYAVDGGTASSTPPAGVTLSGSTLSADPNNPAFGHLALGQTQTIVVSYAVADPDGAAVSQTETITITGTNDIPTVAAALTAARVEGDAPFALNVLAGASDPDDGETAALSIANVTYAVDGGTASSTPPAGVTLSGSTLSVDPNNPAFGHLALGQTQTIVVSYAVADPHGAAVSQTETITITGTNDIPTVAAALTAARVEGDAPFALNVLAGASDPDDGETAALSIANVTYAVDGGTASSTPPAGVTLSGSTLSADPNNPAFGHLALGQTQTIVVSYAVADPHGAAVSQTETITITGTNDIPTVAAALTAARVEGDAPFALNVLAGASDPDDGETAALSIANVTYAVDGGTASSTPPAGVTLSGSTLSVDPNNPAFGHLALGQTQTIVVSYAVADPHGAAVSQTETITITGTAGASEGPSIVTSNAGPTLTVDETFLGADDAKDFSNSFTKDFGTDGPGSTSYELHAVAGASGLVDTLTHENVILSENNGAVEGNTESTHQLVFKVTVDANGQVTLDQQRAVVHDPNLGPNDTKTLAADNLITLTEKITDADHDPAQATLNIGQNLVFADDGPHITTTGVVPTITVDETNLGQGASANFSPNFAGVFGADGQGLIHFDLNVGVGAVGLTDEESGEAVTLTKVGDTIEAHTAVGNLLVFTVGVDALGDVSLTQFRSVVHANPNDPNGSRTLSSADAVTLTGTIFDKDGDHQSATLNIGQNLFLLDDGPTVSVSPTSLVLDNNVHPVTGQGDFVYDLGADDHTALGYALGATDFVNSNAALAGVQIGFTGSVGGTDGAVGTGNDDSAFANAFATLFSEDTHQATFNFAFDYDGNPLVTGEPLVHDTGHLVFDKDAGTYTFSLDNPIEGFTFNVFHTSDVTVRNPDGNSGHPPIVVEQLSDDPVNPLYVQFTADAVGTVKNPSLFSFSSDGKRTPTTPSTAA